MSRIRGTTPTTTNNEYSLVLTQRKELIDISRKGIALSFTLQDQETNEHEKKPRRV